MLKIPPNRKLKETKTTILIPAKIGFQIRINEKMAPSIPEINKPPQFLLPYRFRSIAKLIDEMERKRITKPTYSAIVVIDKAGFVNNKRPTSVVIIPKTNAHPQLCNWFLLASEKMISEIPPNKKDRLNKRARANKEDWGEVKVMILTITKNIPANSGIYQYFNVLWICFKNRFSMKIQFSLQLVQPVIGISHEFRNLSDNLRNVKL